MTYNQIQYWNLQETKQHNRNVEQETALHNRNTEALDIGKLNETTRHNVKSEDIESGKLAVQQFNANEAKRHNQATEKVDIGRLNETARHNQVQEGVDLGNLSINASESVYKKDNMQAQTNKYVAEKDLNEIKTIRETIASEMDKIELDYKEALKELELVGKDVEIQKMKQEYRKLQSDIDRAKRLNSLDSWNTAINGLNAFSNAVRAFK